MGRAFRRLWRDESGQEVAESALLFALIAVLLIAALQMFGFTVFDTYDYVEGELGKVRS